MSGCGGDNPLYIRLEKRMKKEQCAEKLYNQFSTLLYKFMDSDITGNEKESILEELKCMIDEKIREIHYDKFMEY